MEQNRISDVSGGKRLAVKPSTHSEQVTLVGFCPADKLLIKIKGFIESYLN